MPMLEKLLKDEDGDIFRATFGDDRFENVPTSIVRITPDGDVPVDGRDWYRVLEGAIIK